MPHRPRACLVRSHPSTWHICSVMVTPAVDAAPAVVVDALGAVHPLGHLAAAGVWVDRVRRCQVGVESGQMVDAHAWLTAHRSAVTTAAKNLPTSGRPQR